jgi:HK97 family phage major capsid protein
MTTLDQMVERLEALAEGRTPSRWTGSTASPEHVRSVVGGSPNFTRTAPDPRRPYAGRGLGEVLRKALTEGSGSGSFVVPPEHAAFVFDRLASSSVGLRSGLRIIETRRDELHIPRLTADAAANWTAEATAITASDPTIDEVVARPRKLAGLVALSNELRKDSTPGALDLTAENLIRAMALKLDLGFYEGSGTAPEIRGLRNVSGIQSISMGTNGAAFTNLDTFADALGMLEQENATATSIVMHPRTWQSLSKLKEQASGSNKPILMESAGSASQGIDRRIYGVQVFLSSQLSIAETQGTASNASSIYLYEGPQVVAVRREDTSIEIDSSRLFNQDMSEVRSISRWDLVVPNPEAVLRIAGVLP